MDSKLCVDCGVTKPMDEFGPSTRSRDKKRSYCKPCGIKRREPGWSTEGAKTCCRCRRLLPLDSFTRMQNGKSGRAGYCKECHREVERAYYRDNASYRRRLKLTAIAVRYGITADDYLAMEAAQGGRCALCGGPPTSRGLAVDHDHGAEGAGVRALLCSPCNVGLGMFKHDSERLQAAIDYLARFTVSTDVALSPGSIRDALAM